MKAYLIIGNCGTGKTWIMKQLIDRLDLYISGKRGLYWFRTNDENKVCVLGKYTGDDTDGSDMLSPNVMKDNELILPVFKGKIVIAEGDRFTNPTFIKKFNPIIIFIEGSGIKRGAAKTNRQLQDISRRVKRMPYASRVENSEQALQLILNDIEENKLTPKNYIQNSLF